MDALGGSTGCLGQHGDVLAGEHQADRPVRLDGQIRQACAVSLASAGRTMLRPGMARREARCSIG